MVDCEAGDDESDCETGCDEFQCQSGECVSSWRQCDGTQDCLDSSDEDTRLCQPCRINQFQCISSKMCIEESRRCDGVTNCSDASDEHDCPFAEGVNLRTYPSQQSISEGEEVVFQCRDEGRLRVDVEWRRGNGLPLPPGSRSLRGRLEMSNIQVSDTGTFICYALGYPSSHAGAEVSVYLLVTKSKLITHFI